MDGHHHGRHGQEIPSEPYGVSGRRLATTVNARGGIGCTGVIVVVAADASPRESPIAALAASEATTHTWPRGPWTDFFWQRSRAITAARCTAAKDDLPPRRAEEGRVDVRIVD